MFYFFVFFKQKTAYEMRISDWSSDVCSSDLNRGIMRDPRSILITGASSGIGEALALVYARPGIRLILSGRDSARLAAVAAACGGRGASIRTEVIDVTDRAAMARWIERVDAESPLELVIANAGISAGTFEGGDSPDQA